MFFRLLRWMWAQVRIQHDPVAYARTLGVRIGENTRIYRMDPGMFGSEPYLIRLGSNITIAPGVRFLTHDGGVSIFRSEVPDIDVVAPVIVEDSVFIGLNALLLPGVTVGRGAVVGAGAVVTRDVPPDSVVAGNPAIVMKNTSDYRIAAIRKSLGTGSMPRHAKRAFLEREYQSVMEGSTGTSAGRNVARTGDP